MPKGDKIKVRAHTRTVKGAKKTSRSKPEAALDPINRINKGTQIVERDPSRHGKVEALKGVTILGKSGATAGVKRVSRGG